MICEDKFFWFRRSRIVIPGVQGEHTLMHITDTHILACDALSTPAERAETERRQALWADYKEKFARGKLASSRGIDEPYGAPQRIPTAEAFGKMLALAKALQPEALLLSGDILDYPHPAGQRFLSGQLKAYGGRFLCAPGNHDPAEFPGAWRPGMRTLELDGFRIAAVDDSRRTVSPEDLNALRALCAEGVPMIVLCHVPMATPYCRDALRQMMESFYIDSETADPGARAFISLCAEQDAVKAVLCGHVHGFRSMHFAPGKPQITGSQGMAGAVHLVTVAPD